MSRTTWPRRWTSLDLISPAAHLGSDRCHEERFTFIFQLNNPIGQNVIYLSYVYFQVFSLYIYLLPRDLSSVTPFGFFCFFLVKVLFFLPASRVRRTVGVTQYVVQVVKPPEANF